MEETNFVLLWKEQYDKIDESLAINKRLLKETLNKKAISAMRPVMWSKVAGIVGAIMWLGVLGFALFYAISHYAPAADYFIISISAIFLINLKALFDYIKHLVWIRNIDYDGSITEIQQKLTKLHLSIFNHTRVMFLQLPFWSTFYLTSKWFPSGTSVGYIILQVFITASFIYVAFWIYKNLVPENANKKWAKAFIEGSGSKGIKKTLAFYSELEKYQTS